MQNNIITLYVQLLDEGVDTARPTQAIDLGNEMFTLLPTENYDPEDEIWEFLPGSTVKALDITDDKGNPILLAISL
ncbi:MAG: hypothetical protein AAF195_04560 [Pseudomonadota bacterium]